MNGHCFHVLQPILMGKGILGYHDTDNISGDGFLISKNKRRTHLKKVGDIFEDFPNLSSTCFKHDLELNMLLVLNISALVHKRI